MKQFPSNLKYKKSHKVSFVYSKLLEQKVFFPMYLNFGIQAVEYGKLTFKQIEACRRTLRRGLGSRRDLIIRVFTNSPVAKKPILSRMGKGKGGVSYWIAPIKRGQVIFEVFCKSDIKAKFILEKACTKLPMKTRILMLKY